ncbi:Na+/H+ antiporter NhaA [Streptomyces sp. V1I1]|nr:Na+/H+ antiporter NhaA [Streptomyces sp. V1I1]
MLSDPWLLTAEADGQRRRALQLPYDPAMADQQPTPELERSVRQGLASAISPNERLQRMFHPWTSYVIVPLFALANTGIPIGSRVEGRVVGSH